MIESKNGHAMSELVEMAHELNRHLFDENGDAFAAALGDYIRHRKIVISDSALAFLIEAVESARRRS